MPVLLIALYGKKKATPVQVSDELEESAGKVI
jgi:hypothetical protein